MYTFSKEERLCSHKLLNELFTDGNSLYLHPFKIRFLDCIHEEGYPAKVVFSVSKRNFKKAVHRNRIKRMCREAYRLFKPEFYQLLVEKNKSIALAVVYVAREEIPFEIINKKLIQILKKTCL